VLEVCRDFRLPQFKLTELKPTNGNLARTSNVVMPAPPDERVVRADPSLRSSDEGMFSHYTKKKRFSFFG